MRRSAVLLAVAVVLRAGGSGAAGPDAPTGADGVLVGRVVDPRGVGVGGARVVAVPDASRHRWPRGEGTVLLRHLLRAPSAAAPAAAAASAVPTTSAPDGSWRLDGLDPAARYVVRAEQGTQASDPTSRLPSGPGTPVTLTLRPDVTAAIRVVDAVGRPLAGAVIGVAHDGDDGWYTRMTVARATTDATGRAVLRGLRVGRPSVEVDVPGRGALREVGMDVPGEGERILRVGDPAGARYEGTVRDVAGAPIAGARVVVASRRAFIGEEQPSTALVTTTDARGAYRVEGLPPGSMLGVAVAAAGFVPVVDVDARRQVVGGAAMRADVVLAPAGSVEGVVRGPDGAPAAGVTVEAGEQAGVTGADGRYRLDDVPPGVVELRVRAPGAGLPGSPGAGFWDDAGGWWVVVRPGTTAAAPTLPLVRGVRIEGRVVDDAGAPVAGAYVRAASGRIGRDRLSPATAAAAATTGDDGRFAFDGLPPGEDWTLEATTARAATDPWKDATLLATSNPVTVGLVVHPVGRIAGVAVDRDGAGLASVGVRLSGPASRTTTTDAEGRFAFERLPAGRYEVEPSFEQRRHKAKPSAVRVVARGEDARDVVLAMDRPGAIAGVVVDEQGAPAVGVLVALKADEPWVFTDRWGTEENWWNWLATTDDRGRFRFDDLAPGGYTVRPARLDGGSRVEIGDANVRLVWYRDRLPDADGPEVDRMNRWAFTGTRLPLEVRVLAPDGTPVADGAVRVTVHHGGDGGGYQSYGAAVRFGGARTTVPSDAGTVDVEVVHASDAAGVPYDVAPAKRVGLKAEPATLEFTLVAAPAARGPVAGRVVDEEGQPLPGLLVVAYAPKERAFPSPLRERGLAEAGRAATAPDGTFRFERLLPDVTLVRVAAERGRRSAEARVRVGDVDVVLRPSRAALVGGCVTDAAGRPLPGVPVQAPAARTTTSVDGTFRLELSPEVPAVELTLTGPAVAGPPGLSYRDVKRSGVALGTLDLSIVLEEVAMVTGTVVGGDGKLVRDAKLLLEPDPPVAGREAIRGTQAWHSDEGFALEDVPPGRYRLTATDEHGVRIGEPVVLVAPATDVRIVLRGPPSVRGRVVGAGAAGARVALAAAGPTGPELVVAHADASGAFVVPVHGDGPFVVLVTAADLGAQASREGVAVGTDLGNVLLRDGASIAGRVEGPRTFEASRAAVWARAANGLLVPGAVDAAGHWQVPALPPDSTWDVVVRVAEGDAVLVGETRGVRAGARDVGVAVVGR